jgi:hypothetical protein
MLESPPNGMQISCGLLSRPAHKLTFHSALAARYGRAERRAHLARRLHALVRPQPAQELTGKASLKIRR